MNWCEKHDHFKRTCPWCEIEELQVHLNQAIEALEKIDSMEYEVNYGHTHMLYDAKMYARVTFNSIKGGETDATQTSSRS